MAILKGTNALYTGNSTSITDQPNQGLRRRHNFGDRVYKLSPQETPFFAYLNAVGKMPTDDPVFRVLEDRAPTKWADRTFQTASVEAGVITPGATASDAWSYDPDGSGAGASVAAIPVVEGQGAELIVGMLVQAIVWTSETPQQGTARITAVAGDTVSLQTVETCALFGAALDADVDVSFQVIGTAFGEGTNAPDSFGYDMDDAYGFTQIFKTSAYMSNTAMATALRGYSSEWDRIWSMKLREHKVDIERAFLFNNKGNVDGVQYTDGIIGHIIKNSDTWVTADATDLAYAKNKSYARVVDIDPTNTANTTSEASYDRFLKDFEIIFAPERGGADQKFCMASLPVITYFNQMKNGFMSSSANSSMRYNLDFSQVEGGLGHKVMKIETVHGSLAIVKNPLMKGVAKSMMVGIDLDNVKYRPLVGNGVNRDTYIDTNVQTAGEDSRKDLILTEAGLEVCMPESHFLYQFVNNTTPIG